MFRIRLLWIGKTREPFIKEGVGLYKKKLRPYVNLTFEEIRSVSNPSGDLKTLLAKETRMLVKRLDEPANSIFLDEKGEKLSSVNFATLLKGWMPQGIPRITFVVGGAYGFDHSLLPINAKKLRLSEMTFNHQLVRVIFLEQLYRAFTIIRGEPYHH